SAPKSKVECRKSNVRKSNVESQKSNVEGLKCRSWIRLSTFDFRPSCSSAFDTGHSIYRFYELLPGVTLDLEYFLAFLKKLIVAASTFARFFHPTTLQPTSLLKPVEQRIEGGDIELKSAF